MTDNILKRLTLEKYDIIAVGTTFYKKIYILSKSGVVCNMIDLSDILNDSYAINMFYIFGWIKLYYNSGQTIRIKIPTGEYYLYTNENNYNLGTIKHDISVNDDTIYLNGTSLSFNHKIHDIQLYKNCIIVSLYFNPTFGTEKDCCNVYCMDLFGRSVWQIENYFEKYGLKYDDIILSFIVDKDIIYGRTYMWRNITINGDNGNVIDVSVSQRFC